MKLTLTLFALALSAPAALAADPIEITEVASNTVSIFSVNGLTVIENKVDSEASFKAWIEVTAEGNLCTADYATARFAQTGRESKGKSFVTTKEITLEAAEKVDFSKRIIGCTLQSSSQKMRIPLIVQSFPSDHFSETTIFTIKTSSAFGKQGEVRIELTLANRQWTVKKVGFTGAEPAQPSQPWVPAPQNGGAIGWPSDGPKIGNQS